MDITQTAWERSRNIIRSPEVHDPLQQNPLFLLIAPNIPEVLTSCAAYDTPGGERPLSGQRLLVGVLIRKLSFVAQCRWEAGFRGDFAWHDR
jgi:hypothetical protein